MCTRAYKCPFDKEGRETWDESVVFLNHFISIKFPNAHTKDRWRDREGRARDLSKARKKCQQNLNEIEIHMVRIHFAFGPGLALIHSIRKHTANAMIRFREHFDFSSASSSLLSSVYILIVILRTNKYVHS